ncbi:unnamed protein product [Orchesella dallaii]|uniref:Uncharacterized protein n=1 Tax=Orchesella dallaii TaxID=48710 RepID=A0ABP1QYE0_9HEXA
MAFARGGFKFMKKNRSRLEAKTIIDKKINKRRSTKASDKENIKKEDKTKRGDKGRKESINNEKVKKTLNDKNAEKDLTKAKGEGSENKNKNAHKSNYPCCFYIPLDIAMEGLALFDIIYFSCVTITWTVILALEPFAGTNYMSARRNKTVGPQFLDSMMRLFDFQLSATPPPDVGFEYEDRFEETSTTLGPLPYDPVDVDEEKMARTFSRIAYLYSENAQEVDENCGENYFVDYLFTHELAVTRDLFEEIAIIITCASMLYVFLGGLLMATICCFVSND